MTTTETPPGPGPQTPPAPDSPKKRGRKPGTVAKQRKQIPVGEFKITRVSEEDRVKHKRRREERDEQQQAIDQMVYDTYNDWVDAGRPTNWADMPINKWEISKTYAEDAEFFLRKAAALYGRKLVFGQKTESGSTVIIPFCVIARVSKKKPSGE